MVNEVLADLYEVPTKALLQAFKRNIDRSPTDLHVPAERRRVECFEVIDCDLNRAGVAGAKFVSNEWMVKHGYMVADTQRDS